MKIDYDFFERQHKQDGGTADQQRHYELGWEAAVHALGDPAAYEHSIFCKHGSVRISEEDGRQWVTLSWDPGDGMHFTAYTLEDFIDFISTEFKKGVPLGKSLREV